MGNEVREILPPREFALSVCVLTHLLITQKYTHLGTVCPQIFGFSPSVGMSYMEATFVLACASRVLCSRFTSKFHVRRGREGERRHLMRHSAAGYTVEIRPLSEFFIPSI